MSTFNLGRVFTVVAICSAIAACSGQTIDSRQLDFNNGLVYKHGSTTPFTGTVLFKDSIPEQLVEYWSNNVAANGDNSAQNALTGCTAHYTNGVIDGSAECQGASGKTAFTVSFENEKYNGVSKIYNPQTGSLFKVIPWQAGTVDGEEKTYWFDNGNPQWDGHLNGGTLDGSVKAWDHDGKVLTDATFSNGSPVSGLVTDKKGALHYKDGKLDGPAELFNPNAGSPAIVSKGNYSQGERVGPWEDWSLAGWKVVEPFKNLMNSAFRLDTDFGDFFNFSPDHVTSNWTNGSVQGEIDGFDQNGNRIFSISTKDGALNGPLTFRISTGGNGRESFAANYPPKTIAFQSNQPVGCIGDKLRARPAGAEVMAGTIDGWLAECAQGSTSVNPGFGTQPTPTQVAAASSASAGSMNASDAAASPQVKVVNNADATSATLPVMAQHEVDPAADVAQTSSGGIYASFDCAKAGSPVEKMICSNQMLADYDVRLMSIYKAAMAASSDKAAIKDAQRAWMAQRNACTTLDCVSRAYQVRIRQLSATH